MTWRAAVPGSAFANGSPVSQRPLLSQVAAHCILEDLDQVGVVQVAPRFDLSSAS